jgi:hypothetical protein
MSPSLADHPSKSVPIQYGEIVPKDELAHTSTLSKRISKKKIEEFAIQKYRTCGQGIDFSDVMKFCCSKNKAQRILNDCCQQRIAKYGILRAPIDLTYNCRKLVICYSWVYTIMQNVLLHFDKLYYFAK